MKPIIVPGTESAIEPISVEEAGDHLRAANDGGTPPVYVEALLIASLIKSARQACEEELELSLINRRLEVSSDSFNARSVNEHDRQHLPGAYYGFNFYGYTRTHKQYIELPYGPVISVERVNYLDVEGVDQVLDPVEYRISRFFPIPTLQPKYGGYFPEARVDTDSVRIQYNVGYPTGDSPPILIPEPVRTAMLLLIGHYYDNREASTGKIKMLELPVGINFLLGKYRQSLGL
jgi:uncharacterized phiE125 gp8 family phage protein